MRYFSAVMIGLLALSVAACQQSAPTPGQSIVDQAAQKVVDQAAQKVVEQASQKLVEQAGGGSLSVSPSGQSVTLKNDAGESVTISGRIPDELKNFPVPTGFAFKASDSGSISAQEGTTAAGTWTGSGSVQSVSDFYIRTLAQQGWTQDMAMSSGDSGVLMYEKGADAAWITVAREGQTTTIAILYGKNLES